MSAMDHTIEHDDIRLLIWLACVCGKTVSLSPSPPSLAGMYIYRIAWSIGMYILSTVYGVPGLW